MVTEPDTRAHCTAPAPLDDRFGVGPAGQFAPGLFLASLSLVSVLSVRSVWSATAPPDWRSRRCSVRSGTASSSRSGVRTFGRTVDAGVLNLYIHLLGYAPGFLVPFVTRYAGS